MIRLLLLPIAVSLAAGGAVVMLADCVIRRHRRARAEWMMRRRRSDPSLSTPQKPAAGDALGRARGRGDGTRPTYQPRPSERTFTGPPPPDPRLEHRTWGNW